MCPAINASQGIGGYKAGIIYINIFIKEYPGSYEL